MVTFLITRKRESNQRLPTTIKVRCQKNCETAERTEILVKILNFEFFVERKDHTQKGGRRIKMEMQQSWLKHELDRPSRSSNDDDSSQVELNRY